MRVQGKSDFTIIDADVVLHMSVNLYATLYDLDFALKLQNTCVEFDGINRLRFNLRFPPDCLRDVILALNSSDP